MNFESIAPYVGLFILTYFGSIVGALVWAFKHLINYNILIHEHEKSKERIDKIEKDLKSAFDMIRGLKK